MLLVDSCRLDFPSLRVKLSWMSDNQRFSTTRWSVRDLTRYVRGIFETDYRLQDLEVEGEVSNLRIPGSGHAYFTLKDAGAELKCVMWKNDVISHRNEMPSNGEKVVARGYIGVYEAQGVYQMYCRSLRPAGLGDLHARFEELKARLLAEGLFAPERKRPIPLRPQVIGIVTGSETAALQDVLNVLRRRYPLARVILSPTPVQGEQAPPRIIAALDALTRSGQCDVIIVVRGGGSLEDLWCFNDERLARAIAASRVPIVSGVGHETDFTLADFAADLRAPTPTAAAELITQFTIDDLRDDIEALRVRLADEFSMSLIERRRRIDMAVMHLTRLSPQRRINDARQRIDELTARGGRAVRSQIMLRHARLNGIVKALGAINPDATLARGYAIVRSPNGDIVRRADDINPGTEVNIRLHHGRLRATVNAVESD